MIKVEKGLVFTGMSGCFNGRVEVLEVEENKNEVYVSLTKRITELETTPAEERFSQWREKWNLQHTIWGFERGDYLKCNPASFEGYPPLQLQEELVNC